MGIVLVPADEEHQRNLGALITAHRIYAYDAYVLATVMHIPYGRKTPALLTLDDAQTEIARQRNLTLVGCDMSKPVRARKRSTRGRRTSVGYGVVYHSLTEFRADLSHALDAARDGPVTVKRNDEEFELVLKPTLRHHRSPLYAPPIKELSPATAESITEDIEQSHARSDKY